MKKFLGRNFLLQNKTAKRLYHDYAASMPIIDYHCHLPAEAIAEDKNFDNITQAWLYGDHYKWRAMRTNGVSEKYCTGDASDWEKFEKWAETVPYTIMNPLYHWTHLELKDYFGIIKLLNIDSAQEIYEQSSNMLRSRDFSVRKLLSEMKVEIVCTTDDPVDDLEYHKKIKKENIDLKVLPAWRPDKAMAIESPVSFNQYIDTLAQVADVEIKTFNDLRTALSKRHDYFHQNGCRLSDHGLEEFYAEDFTESEIAAIFDKVRSGREPEKHEILKFKSAMLIEFALMDHSKGWVQQFHVGAIRNNNTRLYNQLGPDTGFDSILDLNLARNMSNFFDSLDQQDQLTKTILYNLNPSDNEVFATMIGNYQDGSIPGKMQFGSGWWFLDQKDGMQRQLTALSNLGLLSRFVGMLTDSRSFLSYPRHEYFRRILCNFLGTAVENGELPNEMQHLGKIVQDICYYNAKTYFNF